MPNTTGLNTMQRKYLKMVYPSITRFDLYIKLSKRSHVASFYKNVAKIIMNNDLASIAKDPFGMVNEEKYRRHDGVRRIYCRKFGITIEYTGYNPYVKVVDSNDTRNCQKTIVVKLLGINPLNLSFNSDLYWLTGSSPNSFNKSAYDNLCKLLKHIGISPETVFSSDGSTLGNSMVRNIEISQCFIINKYPKYYIGYSRMLGKANGWSFYKNSSDTEKASESSTWKTEFRVENIGYGGDKLPTKVGVYRADEYVIHSIKENEYRNFGSDTTEYVTNAFNVNEGRVLGEDLKNTLIVKVTLDSIYDILTYAIRLKKFDPITLVGIDMHWVPSLLKGDYSAYDILDDYCTDVFSPADTSIWDTKDGYKKRTISRHILLVNSAANMNDYCRNIYMTCEDADRDPVTAHLNNPMDMSDEDRMILYYDI